MSLLHVVFGLRGIFTRQGKSFEACILTPREQYRCSLFDPLVISQPRLQEFLQKCLQQFVVYIWIKHKPYKVPMVLSELREHVEVNIESFNINLDVSFVKIITILCGKNLHP